MAVFFVTGHVMRDTGGCAAVSRTRERSSRHELSGLLA